ncbi:MAG: hypothetical protein LBF41_10560 [Deltaproteobacteria bacterium]|nr:hypothetical protein [Deltaproteobacteria bacterium]
MVVGLLLAMSWQSIERTFHEWNGVAMLALFSVHNVLNRKWYKTLFRGRYSPARVFQTAAILLALASAFAVLASGITLSRETFGFSFESRFTAFARETHLFATHWGFVFMSTHLGLRCGSIFGLAAKSGEGKMSRPVVVWVTRLLAAGIVVVGARAFVKLNLWSYMTLKTRFAFYDFERPFALFVADHAAMMVTWALLARFLLMLARKSRASRINPEKS